VVIDVSDHWAIPDDGLGLLLDAPAEVLVVMEADGRIVGWNRAAAAMFGWSREEAIGADIGELLLGADLRAGYHEAMARFVFGGAERLIGCRMELAAVHRCGETVPIELGLSVVDCDDRKLFAACIQDISERKKGEARRRRCETIVTSSGEAILSQTLDGTIETWNPAAERLYGYSASQMIGTSVALLAPGGDLDEVIRELPPLHAGGSVSLEMRQRRRDGSLIEVAVTRSPLRDDTGTVTGVVSVVRDVSEARRNAQRLAEAESRFAGAFEAAATGMALTAPDGRFLAVNPALCRFLARDAETLLASRVQDVTHLDDLPAGLRALAGEIDSFQQSKRYMLPDGGIVWGLLTISVGRDAEGAPQYYVSQVQDITDRKTAEGELRRYAARLQALSEQDPLTGLLNQRAFTVALEEELRVLAAGGSRSSLLLAEVDGDDAAVIAAAESLARASRDADHVAHLGDGELAVLLPRVDAKTARDIMERIGDALGDQGVRISHATARPGESARGLLDRTRADLPDPTRLAPGGSASGGPEGIARLLEFARAQLSMPISFLTRVDGSDQVFVRFAGESERFGVGEGDAMPLACSLCQLMLAGRIASIVADLAADPHTRGLELTSRLGLRAYAGVPVRLRSGEIYGTLSGVDTRPHPELSERHIELLGFLSDLIAELIEAEIDERAHRRAQAGATSVRTLLVALEARDFYTSAHSKQVVELASAVARRLGLDQDARRDVEQVAKLHDIGKVGIPDAILQKQGPLDEQEWQLMRQHPIVGEHIIAGTPGLSHLAPAIRAEHEHWDGGGYPDGLAGEQIPLASRITLACDALHAMTSDRPYRPAMTLERAQQELRRCAGAQFDPEAVKALLAALATTPTSPAAVRPTTAGTQQTGQSTVQGPVQTPASATSSSTRSATVTEIMPQA
jgi:PAS domain S-box-containing protein